MALLFNPAGDPTRVYFGTDTHAQCLLVGAALAAGLALWRRRPVPTVSSDTGMRLLSAAGLFGVAACAWAFSQLHYGQDFVFRGGFFVVSLAVAAVILSTVLHPAGIVARGLSWAPLRFIGRISYGMYLWHFPLDIALTGARTDLHGTPLFLFRTLVTVVVSTVSFYALERPIRSGAFLSTVRAKVVTPVAMSLTAAVVVLATMASAAEASSTHTQGSTTRAAGASSVSIPRALASAPVRVLLVGDSVALTLGAGLSTRSPPSTSRR